ncbi:MAG: glycosyltransferase [Defluviitaleaceae bacterium]|nr:glycosyltransferase [Defluviitaleaceae bacterium]
MYVTSIAVGRDLAIFYTSQHKIKLSVIIPLYNVEPYVQRAAESITNQAFDGLEVVVVDDGSTDQSLEVCLKHLPNIKVIPIQQENAGLSAARNTGIYSATGEYIMFLDADDFLLPNAFANILAMLEDEQPEVLFGRYLRWSTSTGFLESKPYNYQPPEDPLRRTEYILRNLPEPSWNAWRYICNRKVIMERELFFESGILCEDVPWSLTLLENVDTIAFLQEPFYAYYQWRPGSIMSRMNPKRLIDLNSIVCKLLEQYEDRPLICSQLVWQSFFYINEYCVFDKHDRARILESYQEVLPLYGHSKSLFHQIAGKCQNPILFHGLSMGMFLAKCARRVLKYKLRGVKTYEPDAAERTTANKRDSARV